MTDLHRTGFTYFKIEGRLNPHESLSERPFIALIQLVFDSESTAGLKYAKAGAKRFSVVRDIELTEGLEAVLNPKRLESSDIEIVARDVSCTYVASITHGRWFCWSEREGIRKLQIIAPFEDVPDECINHISRVFAAIKTAHKAVAPDAADAFNAVNATAIVPQSRISTMFSDDPALALRNVEIHEGHWSGQEFNWCPQAPLT